MGKKFPSYNCRQLEYAAFEKLVVPIFDQAEATATTQIHFDQTA